MTSCEGKELLLSHLGECKHGDLVYEAVEEGGGHGCPESPGMLPLPPLGGQRLLERRCAGRI
jgi:hypothetical protein